MSYAKLALSSCLKMGTQRLTAIGTINVQNEVEIAQKKDLTIIPFRIRDVDLSPEVEYPLANKHWVDAIIPPCEEPIKELIKKVKTCL